MVEKAIEFLYDIDCPIKKQIRFSNGEYLERSWKFNDSTIFSYGKLISNISCDEAKSYQCYDKLYLGSINFRINFQSNKLNYILDIVYQILLLLNNLINITLPQ